MSTVVPIEVATARRLTERIRLMAVTVSENLDKLKALVYEAKESDVHATLGYISWTAYLADVLGETPLRLERDVRQELVAELSSQGMSTRAIAPIVGVDNTTVHRDLGRVANATPPAESEPEPEAAPASYWSPDTSFVGAHPITGEVFDAPTTVTETHTIKTVTGLDGKEYKSTPATPRRTSIIDTARTAGWELRKAVERLERLASDDRFTKNKVEILAALQPHLDFAETVFADLNTSPLSQEEN